MKLGRHFTRFFSFLFLVISHKIECTKIATNQRIETKMKSNATIDGEYLFILFEFNLIRVCRRLCADANCKQIQLFPCV